MATPKITRQALSAVGIHNSYMLSEKVVGKGAVWIDYRPYQQFYSAGWVVRRVGYRTDPNRVSNTFDMERNMLFDPDRHLGVTHAQRKAAALEAAKSWAQHRYGITAWWRDPWGSWHPADVQAVVEKYLAERAGV